MNIKAYIVRGMAMVFAVATVFWGTVTVDAQGGSGTIIDIEGTASYSSKPIPIHLTGLSGEPLKMLRFDLEISGCDIVSKDQSSYVVVASNSGNIVGKLTDKAGDIQFFNRSYKNGTTRAQVHRLAADIVKAIGGDPVFNKQIAFTINTASDKNEIYIADFDGANMQKVTNDGSLIRGLTWGPEDKSLLYCSYRKSFPDIYFHDLETGNRKAIASYTGLNTSPAVSPDGKKVAMILSKQGSPDLYVANIDGTGLKRLTKTAADESSPCWSPDGSKICFSSRMSGGARLYVIPATGGEMKRLKTSGVGSATEPDWSPDGKSIAFTTTTRSSFQICVVPAAGGMVEILAEGEAPNWASNSRTLVFSRKTNKKSSLVMLDVPTKKAKTIANVAGSASQPCWTR